MTGATDQLGDLAAKVLQLITEIRPKPSRIGVLGDSSNPGAVSNRQVLDQTAQRLNVTLVRIDVKTPEDVDRAFATLSRERAEAVIVATTTALAQSRDRVAKLALQNRLPSISYSQAMAEAGVLMSYGTSWPDLAQRAAEYVDRILKGAKPGELPVVQPTKFELVINRASRES